MAKKKHPVGKGDMVTKAEAERMFKFWCKVKGIGGFREVSRKFNRSPSTIYRQADRYNWRGRQANIQRKVERDTDHQVAKVEIKNARLAVQVRNKTLTAFLKRTDLETTVSASDCVRVMEFVEKLGIGGAGTGDGDGSIANPQALAKALEIVKQLGGDGLKAVANWIVRNNKSPEAAVNGT